MTRKRSSRETRQKIPEMNEKGGEKKKNKEEREETRNMKHVDKRDGQRCIRYVVLARAKRRLVFPFVTTVNRIIFKKEKARERETKSNRLRSRNVFDILVFCTDF